MYYYYNYNYYNYYNYYEDDGDNVIYVYTNYVYTVTNTTLLSFQITQQLDVIHKLERDLNQSSRDLDNLQQQTTEDVSDGQQYSNEDQFNNNYK